MINKRKVRMMARTAMYEQHDGRRELKKAEYYKGDYIGMHMVLNAIAMTIGFILIFLLVCAYKFEYIVNNLISLDYYGIISKIMIVYVLSLLVFQVISYLVYSIRYSECMDGVKLYLNRLKKIEKMSMMQNDEVNEVKEESNDTVIDNQR